VFPQPPLMPRVFAPRLPSFVRASRRRRGLFICCGYVAKVRERRGPVVAESSPIPAASATSRAPNLKIGSSPKMLTGDQTSTRLRKVLLMSGDRDHRIRLARIARRWASVNLSVAERANHGLRMALVQEPKLVIVDTLLPDADGLSVMRELRNIGGRSYLPIIVFGLDEVGPEEERYRLAGADAYLTKPPNVEVVDRMALGLLEIASVR
jgi:two-component system, cell cycle response regulator DivK